MIVRKYNIEDHKRQLVLDALNEFGSQKLAAPHLGVTPDTVCNYVHMFNIVKRNGQYKIKEKTILSIKPNSYEKRNQDLLLRLP